MGQALGAGLMLEFVGDHANCDGFGSH
jgi:hypothetical protein